MYRIWVTMRGSVTGTRGYFFKSNGHVFESSCRETVRQKIFALYRRHRPYDLQKNLDFTLMKSI